MARKTSLVQCRLASRLPIHKTPRPCRTTHKIPPSSPDLRGRRLRRLGDSGTRGLRDSGTRPICKYRNYMSHHRRQYNNGSAYSLPVPPPFFQSHLFPSMFELRPDDKMPRYKAKRCRHAPIPMQVYSCSTSPSPSPSPSPPPPPFRSAPLHAPLSRGYGYKQPCVRGVLAPTYAIRSRYVYV